MHTSISIHAPHEGERHFMAGRDNAHLYFNPRSPRGGATKWAAEHDRPWEISIHAPHEGERLDADAGREAYITISIHAPHEGERPHGCRKPSRISCIFQSTLPTRGSDEIIFIIMRV